MNALATTTFSDFDEKLSLHVHPGSGSVRTEKTVLLAEDDEDLRVERECTLRSMGYGVVACADGHLALAAFSTARS